MIDALPALLGRLHRHAEAADGLMLASFEAPDFAEGVASFVERREPSFAPVAR